MPDPITISEPETGALSPEQETAAKDEALVTETPCQEPAKFAGKYASVEDLEKGYAELQKKLSGEGEGDKPEVSESKEEEAAPANASEIYGEYIGSRLDEAGVDYQGMNTKWQETGKLEDDDYKALEGAGFSKDMVEAYLDGVQYLSLIHI